MFGGRNHDKFPNRSISPSADEKKLLSDPYRNLIKPQSVLLLEFFLFYDPVFVEYIEISLHKAKESKGKDYWKRASLLLQRVLPYGSLS